MPLRCAFTGSLSNHAITLRSSDWNSPLERLEQRTLRIGEFADNGFVIYGRPLVAKDQFPDRSRNPVSVNFPAGPSKTAR